MKVIGLLTLVGALAVGVFANEAPSLFLLDPFEFLEGKAFAVLKMEQLVTDPDHSLRELRWTLQSDVLRLSVMGTRLFLGAVDPQWTGTETFTLSVCDPEGACDQQTTTFCVVAVNDPPSLAIPSQTVAVGTSFEPIALSHVVDDPDDAFDSLLWSVSESTVLDIQLAEGVANVMSVPTDWIGVEYVTFTVCDPAGECVSQTVPFVRTDGADAQVQHVGNAGWIVEAPEESIAIDALFSIGATAGITYAMRRADPPFDVDLILVTRRDSYRYSADIIASNMKANPAAVLIAPQDVVSSVLSLAPTVDASRCRPIEVIAGNQNVVDIRRQSIDVGGYVANPETGQVDLGYAFTAAGRSFVVLTGFEPLLTARRVSYPFSGRSFDFAFVSWNIVDLIEMNMMLNLLDLQWLIPVCGDPRVSACTCGSDWDTRTAALCLTESMQRLWLPSK
ncbi:hypothetical protein KKG90_04375 [Candidatus Bipolaricaulota bacterium]|nr:hypothetical protein [Candidatus Bipolaricaulota bacterium]